MKFNTTNISLYTNNNKESIPDWMKGMNTDVKEIEKIDLDIKAKPAFSEKTTINRQTSDGSIREMTASVNETKAKLDSKIELSKFLTGRFFKSTEKVIGNKVVIATTIQSIPASFNFPYEVVNGKIKQCKTFNVDFDGNNYEYPFSKAAFEECLADIKNNKPKMSKVAENVGQYSIINREEIIRRYNGKLREATDKINELIAEGLLVGVSSNSYGSFYDLDQLIPQEEKEKGLDKQGEFEFVQNKEHVEANPYKQASVLAIESSKFLSEIFKDFNIIKSNRDNNELLVSANVLTNEGMTLTAHFSFGIENEKVANLKVVEYNNDRLSLDQFIEKIKSNVYLNEYKSNNKIASRIYKGIVLTEKNIRNILSSCISNDNIKVVINEWVRSGKVKPINSTTFITESSLENLLNDITVEHLSKEDKQQMLLLANKTLMLKTERQDVKDTGVRDTENVEKTIKEIDTKLKMTLSKKLSNYKVANLRKIESTQTIFDNSENIEEILPMYEFDLEFINPKTGSKHISKFLCRTHNGNMYIFTYNKNNMEYTIDEYLNNMKSHPVLSAYLSTNKVNNGSIIKLSKKQLHSKLSDICSMEDIDNAFDKWITSGMATIIAENTIVSKYSIEQLLNNSDIKLLSKDDIEDIKLAKQHFGNQLTAIETKDTGVRAMECEVTDDTMLRACNEYLAKIFESFTVCDFDINGSSANYGIRLFDKNSGISCYMNISFVLENNKVISSKAKVNGKDIELSNVKIAFSKNETLNKYLNNNNQQKFDAPMIITSEKLKEKMKHICSVSEIESVLANWCKSGKVDKIGLNVFASKYTLEQLINDSNLKALSDEEIKNRLLKSMRNKQLKLSASYINDSDTRMMVETWSPERMLIEAKSSIGKLFNSFEILNADTFNDCYELKIRALNPKTGIKQLMNCKFKIINSKISKLEEITSESNNSLELNTLLETYTPAKFDTLGYISKTNLKNVFSKVMGINQIDNAINLLVKNEMLLPVNSSSYALKCTVAELVDHLAINKATNIEEAKEQLQDARRNNGLVIDNKRTMDSASRQLEAKDKELSPNMIKLRDKINNMVTSAYNGKLLTANKYNDLTNKLQLAKEEKDLELISKELRRYLV